jgi:hypothetical protein
VSLSSAGSAATQALRLRSTRSLWDPAYVDESWISTTSPDGVAVGLIPRMKEWVTTDYPGTKTAITEYNWGALDHINGALAQADVLGIFGREGVDLATLWAPPAIDQPGAFAFRMFRNYDGAGHGFGDVSVEAASGDQGVLAVYAAERTSDGALTVLVINKTANSLTSDVSFAGFVPAGPAAVYRYEASMPSAIVRQADQPVTAAGFSATFPANSISIVAMLPAASTGVRVSVGVAGSGVGSVSSDRGGIDCGTICSGSVPAGTSITLSAVHGSNVVFREWRGACAGSGAACTLTPATTTSTTAVLSQVFTDDPVVPGSTTMRAAHLTELRDAVDTLRSRLGLATVSWLDPGPNLGQTTIQARHQIQLRDALAAAYDAAGRTPPVFADTIIPGQTPIKASHVNELRTAIRLLE